MEMKPYLTLKLKGWELTEDQREKLGNINSQLVNIRYDGVSVSRMDFKVKKERIGPSLKKELKNINGDSILVEIYQS